MVDGRWARYIELGWKQHEFCFLCKTYLPCGDPGPTDVRREQDDGALVVPTFENKAGTYHDEESEPSAGSLICLHLLDPTLTLHHQPNNADLNLIFSRLA